MSTHTIESVVEIGEDRRLILQLPGDIHPGRHRVVTVIDPLPHAQPSHSSGKGWEFPVLAVAQWPSDMPLSRAEMYGDDGR